MATTSQRSVLDGHNDSLGSNREVSKGEAKGTGVFASETDDEKSEADGVGFFIHVEV